MLSYMPIRIGCLTPGKYPYRSTYRPSNFDVLSGDGDLVSSCILSTGLVDWKYVICDWVRLGFCEEQE